ncbi:YDG/SRA domain-containing protein [Rhodococcus triatomae]
MAKSERVFGEIDGIKPGASFPTRQAAGAAGVHRPLQAGICGGKDGAESIVVSGGYPDDIDFGDVLIYTGHGGQHPTTKRQVADQDLNDSGNLGLAISMREGLPVRVVRGAGGDPKYSPAWGYEYAGLYRVTDCWQQLGTDGFMMVMFRLERTASPPEFEDATSEVPDSETRRRASMTQRIVRNTAVAIAVKTLHNYTCQICTIRLITPAGPYAEGAHIRALGTPHDGPDRADNLLCLCPNCHVMFDSGAIAIDPDDLTVRDAGKALGTLRTVPKHSIDRNHIAYHTTMHAGLA